MKFFLPHAETPEDAEQVYQDLRARTIRATNNRVVDVRICKLTYRIPNHTFSVEVGQPTTLNGEEVIAIFKSDSVFFVCTQTRGVLLGNPFYIGSHEVLSATAFD